MHILAIESSCDETAVALVRLGAQGASETIAAEVLSQIEEHKAFGGVVPEIAARAHLHTLRPLVEKVMDGRARPDLIAATCGPGLIGGLLVGASFARALAFAWQRPFLAINHLAAHALSPRFVWPQLRFPYFLLLVSGGHCQSLAVLGPERFCVYGQTLDDAPGEALDKAARLLGLAWPGGPALEASAREFAPRTRAQIEHALKVLPRPLARQTGRHASCDFSFSGLKTALARHLARHPEPASKTERAALAFAFQERVMQSLAQGAAHALARFQAEFGHTSPLLAAGGVAANERLHQLLAEAAEAHATRFLALPKELCTDNAVMIAHAAAERVRAHTAHAHSNAHINARINDGLNTPLRPRWPLDAAEIR